MAFWNKSKTRKTYKTYKVIVEEIINKLDKLESSLAPEPVEPAPDLATKPADIVGYCFGFACPDGHVDNTFETVTADDYRNRKACQTCGQVSRPATVKRVAEAKWKPGLRFSGYGTPHWDDDISNMSWSQHSFHDGSLMWTKHVFIKFLESEKTVKKQSK